MADSSLSIKDAGGNTRLLDTRTIGADNQITVTVGDGINPGRVANVAANGALEVQSNVAGSAVMTNVASSATSVTIVGVNAQRRGLILFNDSTAVLYISYSASATSTSAFTLKVQPGAMHFMEVPLYTGTVTGLWASANGSCRVTDLYAATAAGLTGAVGPQAATQPGGSTVMVPGTLTPATITGWGANAVLWFPAGTYRASGQLSPPAGQKWWAAPGAIISGAALVTGWTVSGAQWTVVSTSVPTTAATVTVGSAGDDPVQCAKREDVYYDKVPLTRVASAVAATAGKFYIDYPTQTITIGDDPNGHTVEIAVLPTLIQIFTSGVELHNLTLEGCSSDTDRGMVILNGASTTVKIDACLFRMCHANGLQLYGTGTCPHQIVNNLFDRCGGNGVSAFAVHGWTVNNCEMRYCNNTKFDPAWGTAGSKVTNSDSFTYSNNWSHNNYGPGIWIDVECRYTTVTGNLIEDNFSHGLEYEICMDGTITGNLIRRNPTAGLFLNVSQNVTVTGNYFVDNGLGPSGTARGDLIGYDGDRSGDPLGNNRWGLTRQLKDCVVSGNHFWRLSAGAGPTTGYFLLTGFHTGTGIGALGITWSSNDYHLPLTTSVLYRDNGSLIAFAAWQATGRDTGSTVDVDVSRAP